MTISGNNTFPDDASANEAVSGAGLMPAAPLQDDSPFVIEHLQNDRTPSGKFTPDAQVVVTRALRSSGLLTYLPDSEARSLLAVLTLLTANGRLNATAAQVAAALGISEAKAQSRLDRLCQLRWNEKPVAVEQVAETGLKTVSLSPHVVAQRERPVGLRESDLPAPLPPVAGRDAVVAYSRQHYGRPRAEVEREVAAQFGWRSDIDRTTPAGRLEGLGVSPEDVQSLTAAFSDEEIANQLDWLPYRGAKNPARFVVAAIEGRYEPPARVRLERAIAAESEGKDEPAKPPVPIDIPVGESADLTLPQTANQEYQEAPAEPWDE